MTAGPTGYPLDIMIDSNFSASAADADFARTETADALSVARLRRELSEWLHAHLTLDRERLDDVLLVVNEALTNSAEYAYRGEAHGTMTLDVHYDGADGTLLLNVSDRGRWRHVDPAAQPNTRGRGLPLMRALSDWMSISWTSDGTCVQMRFDNCAAGVRAEAFAYV
ncbi:ATP-binding protein [Mycolicibacterium tusciae]|uniref:ATP-binding protein n=1 Tax=Mycolicibacterium tusciae TaxID=75922 RepID=UPI00024A2325|nr:ATP-binding protein [Mycolicibacterium tusciae]